MKLLAARRVPTAVAFAIIVTIVALVSASTTRDGIALSVAIDLAIACAFAMSFPGLKTGHPVVARAVLTLLGLDV
ncbi:MAG TPA: hypothetical protein VII60_08230, partial [Acidimicrobiales bacterium]